MTQIIEEIIDLTDEINSWLNKTAFYVGIPHIKELKLNWIIEQKVYELTAKTDNSTHLSFTEIIKRIERFLDCSDYDITYNWVKIIT